MVGNAVKYNRQQGSVKVKLSLLENNGEQLKNAKGGFEIVNSASNLYLKQTEENEKKYQQWKNTYNQQTFKNQNDKLAYEWHDLVKEENNIKQSYDSYKTNLQQPPPLKQQPQQYYQQPPPPSGQQQEENSFFSGLMENAFEKMKHPNTIPKF